MIHINKRRLSGFRNSLLKYQHQFYNKYN